MRPSHPHTLLQQCLGHNVSDVRLAAMKATCVFISELESAEERDKFQVGQLLLLVVGMFCVRSWDVVWKLGGVHFRAGEAQKLPVPVMGCPSPFVCSMHPCPPLPACRAACFSCTLRGTPPLCSCLASPAPQAILPALLACIGRALNEGDESAAQVGNQ